MSMRSRDAIQRAIAETSGENDHFHDCELDMEYDEHYTLADLWDERCALLDRYGAPEPLMVAVVEHVSTPR